MNTITNKSRKSVTWLLWGFALMSTPCLAAGPPVPADAVAVGKYLATVGDCVSCHTAKHGEPFAGGRMMNTPFGSISTPNITPDAATGIGDMTDEQFYRVMHEGIGRHGDYLYPVMPFPWYSSVSREDVLAIKTYLFSLKPVEKPRPESDLHFPFNIRSSLAVWRAVFFEPKTFQPDASQSTQVNRGEYLVNGLGHCGECHDSRLLAGTSKFQKPLQGGTIDNWYAPNITSDLSDGIGTWSNQQLVHFLKTGMTPNKGVAVGPMADVVHGTGALTEGDLTSIAAYLKATPPKANVRPPDRTADVRAELGQAAYLDNCASCHGLRGEGQPGMTPPLAYNGAVVSKGPQNVLQVILGGLQARDSYGPMLAIGAGMTDGDVAEVANYVRQQWGNHAPPTATSKMVLDMRPMIDTPMTAGRLHGCPEVKPSALARLIADPKQPLAANLNSTDETNMAQQVAAVIKRMKTESPDVHGAELVNGLTAAYCRVVRNNAQLDWNQRALQLGHFSDMVFMQIHQDLPALAEH